MCAWRRSFRAGRGSSRAFAQPRLVETLEPRVLYSTYDGDDQIAEAGGLSFSTHSGTIGVGNDVDLYRFTSAPGERIDFDLDTASTGGLTDSILRVFDSAGNEIASSDDAAAPGEPASTLESFIAFSAPQSGTYYVGVSSFPNSHYSAVTGEDDSTGGTGGWVLRSTRVVTDIDDQISELNAAAPLTTGGAAVSGSISTGTDADLFRFVASAGQRIGFDVDRPSGSLDSLLRVFDASGNQIARNNDGAAPGEPWSTSSYMELTFGTAGTYYVGVSSSTNSNYDPLTGTRDTSGGTGAYTLQLTNRSIPTGDPDDQTTEAIVTVVDTNGTPTIVGGFSIGSGTDVDLFRFTAIKGQRVSFDVDRPSGGGLDSYLRIFNSSGSQIATNNNAAAPGESAGVDSYLQYTFGSTGTYYVGVSDYNNTAYSATGGTGDANSSPGSGPFTLTMQTVLPTYYIELSFADENLTVSQRAVLFSAAYRWGQVVTGDLPSVQTATGVVDDMRIEVKATSIDGKGGVLAEAGPTGFRSTTLLPYRGSMELDAADLSNMENGGSLYNVVLHEMGHVLGIGTLWDDKGLISGAGTSNPVYTGAAALAQYNAIFGYTATSVPLENSGNAGTRDTHWRESVFGNELMTGYINSGSNPLSRISVASLIDLGYQVNLNAADNYTRPS